jgi:hypothetical protein
MEPEIKVRRHFGLKFILILLGMILIAGVVGLAIIRDRIVNYPQNQVTIIGQGRISYEPDIANVTLGVQIDKVAKAEDALKQLNEKMDKIVAALKAKGILAEDIKTQNYSLQPQYDYNNGIATTSGFNANEQLVVKVKDIKADANKLSQIVEAASLAGANQIVGITFDLSNLESLKQEARLAAIADAKSKAGVLAAAAGIELGDVIGWWENLVQSPYSGSGYYGVGGGGGGAPVVPAGNQEIVVEMNVNYRVK